jgi:hypothetical protein
MRQLTSREKRLAIFLGLAVFVVVNLIGLVVLKRQRVALENQLSDLESRAMVHEVLLGQKREWLKKEAWMSEHQPVYSSPGDAMTDLVEDLSAGSNRSGLDMTPPRLDEVESFPTHNEVSATVEVSGSLRSVVGWLAQLQQPEKFQAVTSFSLASDKEPPNVKADLRVARWFRLDETAESLLIDEAPAPPARFKEREAPASPPGAEQEEDAAEAEDETGAEGAEAEQGADAVESPEEPGPAPREQ